MYVKSKNGSIKRNVSKLFLLRKQGRDRNMSEILFCIFYFPTCNYFFDIYRVKRILFVYVNKLIYYVTIDRTDIPNNVKTNVLMLSWVIVTVYRAQRSQLQIARSAGRIVGSFQR